MKNIIIFILICVCFLVFFSAKSGQEDAVKMRLSAIIVNFKPGAEMILKKLNEELKSRPKAKVTK